MQGKHEGVVWMKIRLQILSSL